MASTAAYLLPKQPNVASLECTTPNKSMQEPLARMPFQRQEVENRCIRCTAHLDATARGLVAVVVQGGEGPVVQQHDGNSFGVILVQALPGQVQLRLLGPGVHQWPQCPVKPLLLDDWQRR